MPAAGVWMCEGLGKTQKALALRAGEGLPVLEAAPLKGCLFEGLAG